MGLVDDPDTCTGYPGFLYITIFGYRLENKYGEPNQNCVFSISVTLNQICNLFRDTTTVSFGNTWTMATVANSTISQLEEFCNGIVSDYVDAFINDYLAVNPKD